MSASTARSAQRAASVPPITYPPELPVSARRDELLEVLRDHQVVIVAGETGSGKTTQLPKICLELGRGIEGAIAHTQPRRIAARTVAARIAEELGVPLGGAVGYAVRFEKKASEDTLIRLMTDGLLLAEIAQDRLLGGYDTIIVDEAHERSLNIDFLLGYLVRLLPKRPDLKVIITSATIDAERFSEHFGGAPVVEVSGRTYPVEVRYRPLTEDDETSEDDDLDDRAARTRDRDQPAAIAEAVEELFGAGRAGDVLVFLSGEREIRDTADTLAGRFDARDDVEILSLYARLATADQQRVFRRGESRARRRVVLATNVAETSLTVPGIRYVVDAGTARVSRYSARLKVQRLPIEPVSQASAQQRAGRCGRTADGICIRLYSEQDHDARPRFTDPEILRTNLASVILQMASLDLGEVAAFPFLDPPDHRQIRDGELLLTELGAIERDGERIRLTKLGRRLARLPVDPRLGRMVLEADRRGCAEEVIVVVAALSIQDPRMRPTEGRAQADQLHARFKDEHSDFVAFLNLWRYLEEQQEALSRSAFRRRCKDEHLHHLRIREWQDLVARLRQAARGAKVELNQEPCEPRELHQAILAGLLSHVGMRDAARREYLGARGARFAIFPGSGLAKAQPSWVMAAELVETSRLFAREVARIEPAWIEPLAEHLVKREYSEPRWDRRRAGAVATERVTLYGLPVVSGRTVAYGAIDPALSRELFLRRALVEGDWDTPHAFDAENRRLVAEVEQLEDRSRSRGLLVSDDARYAFLHTRVPLEIVSGQHFDRWWKDARRADPDRLTYTPDLLLDQGALAALDPQGYPSAWKQGDMVLELSYRFEPGADDDGVAVHVPLDVMAQVAPREFEWLVPGLRHELVTTLLRGLPKDLRRGLVPIPETATAVLEGVRPRREPLLAALERELERRRGVRVARGQWNVAALPEHLRMRFQVEDDGGAVLAIGHDLDVLREQLRPRLRAELAAAAPELQATGLRAWTIGTLPREVELRGATAKAYPALVDEGATAGVRVYDTSAVQEAAMRAGTRRLLLLTAPSPARWVREHLDLRAQVVLAGGPLGDLDSVLADATGAAVDALVARAGGPAWDEAAFAALRGHVAGELAETTRDALVAVAALLDLRDEVITRVARIAQDGPLGPVRSDVLAQLGALVHPGFLVASGLHRLPDIERYLRAILHRLERLGAAGPGADAQRMAVVHELEEELRAVRDAWPAGTPPTETLREIPWLIQELRVSLFAQPLGARGQVSAKRIRKALAATTPAGRT